jgi:Zn/Cd-binding protein ZinT
MSKIFADLKKIYDRLPKSDIFELWKQINTILIDFEKNSKIMKEVYLYGGLNNIKGIQYPFECNDKDDISIYLFNSGNFGYYSQF